MEISGGLFLYYSKKVYSKVTLDVNIKCKDHRGGK